MCSTLYGIYSPGATAATTPAMMTTMIPAGASASPMASPKTVGMPTPGSNKRRRRTPATGAADDCFACRRRQIKCDRRRPYCTQCLDQGKDCSGYKTQLTWGVGVASRGKLRGQSLPIAMKATASPKVPARRPRLTSTTTDPIEFASTFSEQSTDHSSMARLVRTRPTRINPAVATAPAEFHFNSLDSATSVSQSPGLYSPSLDYPLMESSHGRASTLYAQRRPYHHSLQLNTPLASSYEEYGLPTSASSMSGFSESDIGTPLEFPDTPGSAALMLATMPMYEALPPQPMMPMSSQPVAVEQQFPTSYPDQYERTMSARSLPGPNYAGLPAAGSRKPTTSSVASSSVTDFMAGGLMLSMGGAEMSYECVYPAAHRSMASAAADR